MQICYYVLHTKVKIEKENYREMVLKHTIALFALFIFSSISIVKLIYTVISIVKLIIGEMLRLYLSRPKQIYKFRVNSINSNDLSFI